MSDGVFAALANPTRRAVLTLLQRNGPMAVGDIAAALDVVGPTLSWPDAGHLPDPVTLAGAGKDVTDRHASKVLVVQRLPGAAFLTLGRDVFALQQAGRRDILAAALNQSDRPDLATLLEPGEVFVYMAVIRESGAGARSYLTVKAPEEVPARPTSCRQRVAGRHRP